MGFRHVGHEYVEVDKGVVTLQPGRGSEISGRFRAHLAVPDEPFAPDDPPTPELVLEVDELPESAFARAL